MINLWMTHPLSRLVSLLLAIGLSAVILIYPHALMTAEGDTHHGALMLLLAGISIGFIHGVGFAPTTLFWRYLFSPMLAWLIMIPGLIYLLLN